MHACMNDHVSPGSIATVLFLFPPPLTSRHRGGRTSTSPCCPGTVWAKEDMNLGDGWMDGWGAVDRQWVGNGE